MKFAIALITFTFIILICKAQNSKTDVEAWKSYTVVLPIKEMPNIAIVRNNQKFGVVDSFGKVIIPFDYTQITFYKQLYLAQNLSKGITDVFYMSGQKSPHESFNSFSIISDSCLMVYRNGFVGLLDLKDRFVLPIKYKAILIDINKNNKLPNRFWVSEGKEYKFIDVYGKVYSDKHYVMIENLGNNKYWASYTDTSDNKEYYVILDSNCKTLTSKPYDYIRKFENNITRVYLKNKVGFIDISGTELIAPQYDAANDFKNYRFTSVLKDKKYGVINREGKLLIPFKYKEIKIDSNVFIVKLEENKYNFVDTNGKSINSNWYYDAYPFNNGFSIVQNKDKKYAIVNVQGKQVCDFKYDYIEKFNFNYCKAKKENSNGYLNKVGQFFTFGSKEYEEGEEEQRKILNSIGAKPSMSR